MAIKLMLVQRLYSPAEAPVWAAFVVEDVSTPNLQHVHSNADLWMADATDKEEYLKNTISTLEGRQHILGIGNSCAMPYEHFVEETWMAFGLKAETAEFHSVE